MLAAADDKWRDKLLFVLSVVRRRNITSFLFAGEQDESICKSYITQIKNLRLQIEECESRTVGRIRQAVDKDALRGCMQKTADQRVRHTTLLLHIYPAKKNVYRSKHVKNTSPKSQSMTIKILCFVILFCVTFKPLRCSYYCNDYFSHWDVLWLSLHAVN